jgi:hypothetical protein
MPKIKFEKTLLVGSGKITWYMKAERWAKKQKFPISFLLLGIIDLLKKWWIDVKIYNTMRDVDKQTDELLQSWKEPERRPNIVETGVFGDEGWSIEISNPIVERGTSSTSTGMVTPSDAQRLQEDEGDQGTT